MYETVRNHHYMGGTYIPSALSRTHMHAHINARTHYAQSNMYKNVGACIHGQVATCSFAGSSGSPCTACTPHASYSAPYISGLPASLCRRAAATRVWHHHRPHWEQTSRMAVLAVWQNSVSRHGFMHKKPQHETGPVE